MRGAPISKNNVFIILISGPNSWKSAHLLSSSSSSSSFFLSFFFFFFFFNSYGYLGIFFFWINKKLIEKSRPLPIQEVTTEAL